MNNLEKQYLIKKEKLNKQYYFQSFIQEASNLKLLSASELEKIQMQSLQLLSIQTKRYTNGESSSVKVETAQNIFQSINYCIGIYLKSLLDTDKCLNILKEKPLLSLYKQGKELVYTQFNTAKKLLSLVQENCISTDNIAYNDTINSGLPEFFQKYDFEYAGHDGSGSIDYPLSSDKMDLVGVEYILSYLQKLYLENIFCKNYNMDDIHKLMLGYDKNYKDLLINIFELVLTNSLGSVLLNKNALNLNITPSDRQKLKKGLSHLSKDAIKELLEKTSYKLCIELNISNIQLQKYILDVISVLSLKLKNAIEINNLEAIFISFNEEQSNAEFQFEDGKQMDDELFRKITDEIRDCRFVSDKTAIIKNKIHSITDLVDVLEGSCIFDDEFTEVFKVLDDMTLALLLKKSATGFTESDLHFTENEKEWQKKLSCFLKEIDFARKEKINNLAKKIELKEN